MRTFTLDEIKQKLKGEDLVTVYFKKINGEPRKMICSWNEMHVPYPNEHKGLKDLKEKIDDEEKQPTSLSVWDCEKQDWRSFRLDSVYRIGSEQVVFDGKE